MHNYTAGEDFVALNLVTLSFEVGELRKCIDITILKDSHEEGNGPEYIALQLLPGSSSGQDDININFNVYQVAILDSDGKYKIAIPIAYSLISCYEFVHLPCPALPPSPCLPAPCHMQFSCWDSHRQYMKLWRLKHKQYVCEFSMEVLHLVLTWELHF